MMARDGHPLAAAVAHNAEGRGRAQVKRIGEPGRNRAQVRQRLTTNHDPRRRAWIPSLGSESGSDDWHGPVDTLHSLLEKADSWPLPSAERSPEVGHEAYHPGRPTVRVAKDGETGSAGPLWERVRRLVRTRSVPGLVPVGRSGAESEIEATAEKLTLYETSHAALLSQIKSSAIGVEGSPWITGMAAGCPPLAVQQPGL
jgi:hypothetical protein